MTEEIAVIKPALIAAAGVTGTLSMFGNGPALTKSAERGAETAPVVAVTPVSLTTDAAGSAEPRRAITDSDAIAMAIAAGERHQATRDAARADRRGTAPWQTRDTATEDADGHWTVTGSAVNLRAGPSTSNPVVGRVSRGDRVAVLSRPDESWIKIRANGETAWIYGRFLAPEGVPAR